MTGAGSRVAVLGAGMLGLMLARHFARAGYDVTIFEAAPELGGLTRHFSLNGCCWDRFYHVVDVNDDALIDLLNELGLADRLQWRKTRTLLYDGERHHPLDNAVDYFRMPVLGFISKLRVGMNILYAGARRSRHGLEGIPADRWLARWSGRRAYERLWAPLLRSKLGENYRRASAAYIWSVIRRFYGARHGKRREEVFGYITGGYACIVDALVDELTGNGVRIRSSCPARMIRECDDQSIAIDFDGHSDRFDTAIVTYAGELVAKTCVALDPVERAAHADIRYQGVICLSLLTTRSFGDAYMTYITDPAIPFTTVIEMSALTGTEEYGGNHLVYLPRYLPSDDASFEQSDAEIASLFLAGLERMYPDFHRGQIVASRVARARYVMAIPELHYSSRLPPVRCGESSLFVCNSARIVDAALSVNESVSLANSVFDEWFSDAGT